MAGVEQALRELDGVRACREAVLVVVHERRDEHRALEDVPVRPVLLAPQDVHLQRQGNFVKLDPKQANNGCLE